jgi:hypothetical protein
MSLGGGVARRGTGRRVIPPTPVMPRAAVATAMARRPGAFNVAARSDRSFYVVLAVIGLILVLTLVVFVVFGFPDATVPGGPQSK